jgi:membrane protease YdiL (CAAX protease family)
MNRPLSAQAKAAPGDSSLAVSGDPQATPPERPILIAYYLFGAGAWGALGAIFGRSNELGPGLALSALKALAWVLPAVILGRAVFRDRLGKFLGVSTEERPAHPFRALALGVGFLALTSGLQMLASGHAPALPAALFSAFLLQAANAVIEEISFRGVILGRIARHRPFWQANLAQAVLFLLVHWVGWLAQGPGWEMLPMSLALTVFALVLGAITRWTGSVWGAVVVHAVNNLLAAR